MVVGVMVSEKGGAPGQLSATDPQMVSGYVKFPVDVWPAETHL